MNLTDSPAVSPDAPKMRFQTRKLVKPEDLNANGTLFGGRLLAWIDEEAAIYAICQLETTRLVTKFMSEINFISSARTGDVVEIGILATSFGRTSLTLRCEVRNKITRKSIITVDKMVFVSVDEAGHPHPHGKSKMTYGSDVEREVPSAEREKTTVLTPLVAPPSPELPREYSLEDPVEHVINWVGSMPIAVSPAPASLPDSPAASLGEAHLG